MIDAGGFSAWLAAMVAALDGEADADVPCGGCTACCRAGQFVLVEPDEHGALAHIPAALLFPAPRMAAGHRLLGYDEHGRCPMLVDDACSIYEHRPRACRTYDCRVFPAAGVEPDEPAKVEVRQRAAQWRFAHPTAVDQAEHDAVRAAAAAITDAVTATERAVRAVRQVGAGDEPGTGPRTRPSTDGDRRTD